MKNLKFWLITNIATLLLISCGNKGTQENSIQAEDMVLTNYQSQKEGTRTFIKLTDSTGIAKINFPFASGNYDIDVSYLSESIGQNTYAMYVNENQIISWLGKNKDDNWHLLSEQKWHVPQNISINKGDEIRIEAFSENQSLAIFDYIKFSKSNRLNSEAETLKEHDTTKQKLPIQTLPKEELVTIYPTEYNHALKNPLKGFRPSNPNHEFGTLIKSYIRWNEIENSVNDGVEKIKDFSNEKWLDLENRNIKVIPRVYLSWPGQDPYWPADMNAGDFTSNQFKERVVALIKKIGEAWDNDSRVAYVEMGLIGEWGEMEFPDTTDDIKKAIAAQFNASFKNKLVMIRWPNTYEDHIYNFGYYWDSFAHQDQEYYGYHVNNTAPKWKTAVIGGEVAYNWGNMHIQPGESPDESLVDTVHRDYILDRIRKLHTNHLGWISKYNQNDENVRTGADIMQKALGYRFVISEISYPKNIKTDSEFTVSFKVKNTGSSPFYYNWPLEISLLDINTKQVVWKEQCADIDITKWMPGDKWINATNSYSIPAKAYTANQTLHIKDVPSGEYILAIAILDPADYKPNARFAIENYYNGGRHPIGKIGIDKILTSFTLSRFDDIQSDATLSYEKVIE